MPRTLVFQFVQLDVIRVFQPCACLWCCNTKTSANSVLPEPLLRHTNACSFVPVGVGPVRGELYLKLHKIDSTDRLQRSVERGGCSSCGMSDSRKWMRVTYPTLAVPVRVGLQRPLQTSR